MVATRFDDVVKRLEDLETRLNSAVDRNNTLELKILEMDTNFQAEREASKMRFDEILNDICIFQTQMYKMDVRLIEVEQYSRRESLVITGIPDSISQRDLEGVVINILGSIGVRVQSYDISACHRLFKKQNDTTAKTIIKFINRKIIGSCLLKQSLLYKCKFTINLPGLGFEQHLCASNDRVLRECKKLSYYGQIQDFFTWNGFIKIVRNNFTKPLKINHIDELYDLFDEFYQYDNLYKF